MDEKQLFIVSYGYVTWSTELGNKLIDHNRHSRPVIKFVTFSNLLQINYCKVIPASCLEIHKASDKGGYG